MDFLKKLDDFWFPKEKPVLDDQPKTDTLQPNQPAGDTSMVVTLNLTPYAANTGAVTINTINDPAHNHGLVTTCYPTIAAIANYPAVTYNAGIPYTIVSPQYYQAGTGTLVNQPWPSATAAMTNNQWYDPSVDAYVKPAIDRAEFSEEEISQAELLMEELSA